MMYTMYMALHINNPEVEAKVRILASKTGESMTDAIGIAVQERLSRVEPRNKKAPEETVESILGLVRSYGLQRINPDLSEDEILGYGPNGYCE